MSTADYDQADKLFGGTWKCDKDENLEEFMTAAGMSEELKKMMRAERTWIMTRVGDTFHEKTIIEGKEYEMTTKFNEVTEWKDNDEDPKLHVKTTPKFKDGVWTQDVEALPPTHFKTYIVTATASGDELIMVMNLSEDPTVTTKRIYKKASE